MIRVYCDKGFVVVSFRSPDHQISRSPDPESVSSVLISGKFVPGFQITRDDGDVARSRLFPLRGKVFANGKEDLLVALYRAGRCHGLGPAVSVVESGAHLAAARPLLVGGIQERVV